MNISLSSEEAITLGELKVVNMHEAKTHLSSLVGETVAGKPFIIAKAGKPQAIVYSYQAITQPSPRVGFMPEIEIIGDFYELDEKIAEQFSEGAILPDNRLSGHTV